MWFKLASFHVVGVVTCRKLLISNMMRVLTKRILAELADGLRWGSVCFEQLLVARN